jgi:hypothetical protein
MRTDKSIKPPIMTRVSTLDMKKSFLLYAYDTIPQAAIKDSAGKYMTTQGLVSHWHRYGIIMTTLPISSTIINEEGKTCFGNVLYAA